MVYDFHRELNRWSFQKKDIGHQIITVVWFPKEEENGGPSHLNYHHHHGWFLDHSSRLPVETAHRINPWPSYQGSRGKTYSIHFKPSLKSIRYKPIQFIYFPRKTLWLAEAGPRTAMSVGMDLLRLRRFLSGVGDRPSKVALSCYGNMRVRQASSPFLLETRLLIRSRNFRYAKRIIMFALTGLPTSKSSESNGTSSCSYESPSLRTLSSAGNWLAEVPVTYGSFPFNTYVCEVMARTYRRRTRNRLSLNVLYFLFRYYAISSTDTPSISS